MGKKTNRRPKFFAAVRQAAIESARDDSGQVVCAHCVEPITDDQTITLHHVVPWSELTAKAGANPVVQLLPEEKRKSADKRLFNGEYDDVENLVPLHVACHRELHGYQPLSPEDTEQLNRKSSGRIQRKKQGAQQKLKDTVRRKELEALPEKAATEARTQQFSMKKKAIKLENASLEVLQELRGEAQDELEAVQEKLDNFRTPSSIVGEVRVLVGRKMDKLVTQKHGLYGRLDTLEEYIALRSREQKAER